LENSKADGSATSTTKKSIFLDQSSMEMLCKIKGRATPYALILSHFIMIISLKVLPPNEKRNFRDSDPAAHVPFQNQFSETVESDSESLNKKRKTLDVQPLNTSFIPATLLLNKKRKWTSSKF
jgi:hypothetical protein